MQLPAAAPAGDSTALGGANEQDEGAEGIQGVLTAVRRHLGMDVAFISCVFRPIVTARSGNVTGDFGIVTGRSGAVTDEIRRE